MGDQGKLELNVEVLASLRRSLCPYASRGRYVLGARWDGILPTPRHLDSLAQRLTEEAAKPQQERADAVIAVVYHDRVKMSCRHLSEVLLAVLAGLHARDQSKIGDLFEGLVTSLDSWDFVFQSVAYFVPVFSWSYPSDHARKCDLVDTSLILFQPEHAFRRFNIRSDRPQRLTLTEQVLSKFAAGGKPYRIETVTHWPKALRYVKPPQLDDGPIAWWLTDQEP
jgi:hypothetical protein